MRTAPPRTRRGSALSVFRSNTPWTKPHEQRKRRGAELARVPRIRSGVLALGLAALAFAPSGASAPLSAQELNDSLRNVVRERLERLTRRLGDSTDLLPDTTEMVRSIAEMADDSTLKELLSLPGYQLVQYRSQSAIFETESRVLTLLGSEGSNAVMNREGLELSADSALVFDERTGRLVTMGQEASYTPEDGDQVLTRRIIYDLNENRGTALDARTQMNAGMGDWIVRGDFPSVSQDENFGHEIQFTSCEEDEPHYHFLAREIKIVPGGTLVARNVLLYFGDVGVFWLPFIAQSTETGRRSGLLPVRFSVNDIVRTSGSYARRISNLGFYWAMSDYTDAEMGFDWWSGNYVAATGRFQYSWLRQFLQGRADFRQFWRAEGGSEVAFNTQNSWEISERSQVRLSASYASSSSFVRRNSFDPREVTQSIDSDGGFNRRFDWGNLSVSANRRQFLSDDRVEMTMPTANLSLSTITLLSAPFNRARFYNNMTLSASGRFSRSVRDLPAPDLTETDFTIGLADSEAWRGGMSATLSAGAFSIAQSFEQTRDIARDLPVNFFDPQTPVPQAGIGSVADLQRSVVFPQAAEGIDFNAEARTWSTGINYQQNLVGSTSITPQLSISGRSIRSDTASVGGGGFISAPGRLSFGAQLKLDAYGFYRGDTFRHKFSPTFDYAYSPETKPTQIQQTTFGTRAIQPKNEIRIGLTQTFEARVDEQTDSTEVADSTAMDAAPDTSTGPRRLPRSRKVTVLAWRTSAVTFDFEQASELGSVNRGFADNLRISNQFSSDFLRGLSVSVEHDMFDDSGLSGEGGQRKLSPLLANLNLSFSLSNQSAPFRWLRRLTAGGEEDTPAAPPPNQDDEGSVNDPTGLETADMGEATIVPGGSGRDRDRERQRSRDGNTGEWNASLSYSLARSRGADVSANKMLQGNLSFQPTEKWSVSWRTSYDAAAGVFNDHVISLQRDLHRWEADFSFQQTATGNWSFVFEVALSDNRDLHFDYEQRTGGERR
ncbi:MAG: putative LPS assembly protein LptD [Gemmatimonadetes bacterium]|nr:putative LPS assembly protein LptD [Gemmatimonadota bacterium]